MRTLARLALSLGIVGVLVVAAGAAAFVKLRADVYARREARIAALTEELATVRHTESLTAAQACAIAEHHLLTRTELSALAVHCDTPAFELRGPRAGLLTGAVRASDLDNALLGGGFATPLRLARSAAGWDVVGEAWRLDDCRIDVAEDAPDAAAITSAATGAENARKRANAIATLDAVRTALATAGTWPGAAPGTAAGPPPACTDLPVLEHSALATISDAPLEGRAPAGLAGSFGYGMNGCHAPLAVAPGAAAPPFAPVCGLDARPAWVLVFDDVVEDPPVVTGTDTYTGGTWRATARLVDVGTGTVRCARPITFALPEKVVTIKSASVQSEYTRGVKGAVCEGIEALGRGHLRLDPWWGC